jgi:Na+/H+ antiporter NhaD/arsenite permease-like protein
MWIVGFLTFFLSSILGKHDDRLFFAGIIVIAANVGGAWTPIGDVTTTMLWIVGQITSLAILFGLGILWAAGDLLHRHREDKDKDHLTLVWALTKIHMGSIVFFIGILLAVATLELTHILSMLAQWLDRSVARLDIFVVIIGLVSAIADNVPLVAASMGMYQLAQYPNRQLFVGVHDLLRRHGRLHFDHWLSLGRPRDGAGKIHFFWYVRKVSGLALVGYLAGALVYLAQYQLTH